MAGGHESNLAHLDFLHPYGDEAVPWTAMRIPSVWPPRLCREDRFMRLSCHSMLGTERR